MDPAARTRHKGSTVITFNSDVGYVYPHRCWSCLVPCLICEGMVVGEIDGQLHTFAHELDKWTPTVAFSDEYEGRPTPAMGRFSGKREWETLDDGWDLADAIVDLNFVRPTARPWSRNRIYGSTTRRCGRSTTCAATRSDRR